MINLLPQQQKKTLRQELRLRLVLILSISIVSFFLSLIFLLGANWIYLGGLVYSYRSEVMSSQEKVLGADEETSKEVKAVNRTLTEVSSLYGRQIEVSVILKEIELALPQTMYLTSFQYTPPSIEKQGEEIIHIAGNVSVSGFAVTRDDLFLFRESLQEKDLFYNLSFPPSNWVRPSDINFTFNSDLNL
tara:strand:+ start:289 stop:855 length:567 start_codon:yes stop_codon:yes gene_type:complete